MKDMVTNGTGNSRFLKSSLASGTTWETALAQLRAGTFPVDFNGLNTGGITQQGSAYSKANVLPDDVCSLLGLNSTTAEPKDAFQVVGNPAELWVWKKDTLVSPEVPAHTVETTKNDYIYQTKSGYASKYYTMTIIYGSAVNVNDDGSVSIVNPSTKTDYPSNLYTYFNGTQSGDYTFVGKYIQITGTTYTPASTYFQTLNQNVIYIPQGMTIDANNCPSGTFQEITGAAKVPANITVEYLSSANPSAYPDSQTVGNVTITKLGQIGEGVTRVETGSYVGTGTYGSGNPNSLTFGFAPKIVIVGGADNTTAVRYRLIMIYGSPYATGEPGNSQGGVYLSWSGKTVSWYNQNATSYQMNILNTYYYTAIG